MDAVQRKRSAVASASLAVSLSVIVCSCGGRKVPNYRQLGGIGTEGDITTTYKIPDAGCGISGLQMVAKASEEAGSSFSRDWYPETVGAGVEIRRGEDIVMRLFRTTETDYEVTFASDFTHNLGEADGLREGEVTRTIHAGVSLIVSADNRSIRTIHGPPDEYSVLSKEAVMLVGDRTIRRGEGTYSAPAFMK